MLRSLLLWIFLLILVALAVTFATLNPGRIVLDFAFGAVEIEQSIALIGAMTVGWIFGLLCVGGGVLRLLQQRRSLRRSLRLAEQEVQALRSMPGQDAD